MFARGLAGLIGYCIIAAAAHGRAQAPSAQFPPEAQTPPAAPPPAVAASPAPLPPQAQPTRLMPAPAPPTTTWPTLRSKPAEKPSPNWNLGAGIGLSVDSLGLTSATVPTYEAALERRLGRRTWLALHARASYEGREVPGDWQPEQTERVTRRSSTTSLAALLGLRYVFVKGVVDVSVFAGVFAAYQHVGGVHGGEGGLAGLSAPIDSRALGVLAGLAVERELVDGLGLRLSLDSAAASLSHEEWLTIDNAGDERTFSLSSQRLGLSMRPSLQLHFYF